MKSFVYNQNNEKFIIYTIQQNTEILIQCIWLDATKNSSTFNLQQLKNIDKVFGGSPSRSPTI